MVEARRTGRPPGSEAVATRRRLLRHAREVFSAVGYQDATPAQIADRARVTRAMIYRYFGSKASLYEAVFAGLREEVIAALVGDEKAGRESPPAPRHSALSRILAVFRRGAAMNRQDATYARFTMSALVDTARIPELTPLAAAQVDEVRGHFLALLDEAAADGDLPAGATRADTANALAAVLWGMGVFAAFRWDADEMDRATSALVGLLQGGLSGRGVPWDDDDPDNDR